MFSCLLERLQKADECFSIRRQGMFHEFASIFFIEKPCLIKPPRVLADSFFVRAKRFNNILQRYTITLSDKKQYLNTIVI